MAATINFSTGTITRTTASFEYSNSLSDSLVFTATGGGSTVAGAVTESSPTTGTVSFSGLNPGTTYTVTDGNNNTLGTFTTVTNDPKVATESQWEDLAARVKAKADASSVPTFTMTSTDPGEGSTLAANNYVAVYGGDPIIIDYSLAEINTGTKWVNGSTIYKKTINFGSLPNATTASVSHSISSLNNVVKIEGYMTNGSSWRTLPYADGAFTSVYANTTQVSIYTTADMSSWTGYVTLYYTKSA